jgi:hypothetical protein
VASRIVAQVERFPQRLAPTRQMTLLHSLRTHRSARLRVHGPISWGFDVEVRRSQCDSDMAGTIGSSVPR